MVNVALLRATLEHIVARPELHDQTHYFSVNEFGVAACFAGRALLLSGYRSTLPDREGAIGCFALRPDTGETVAIWEEARRLLGLTRHESTKLFNANNTRAMLESLVESLSTQPERYCDLISG